MEASLENACLAARDRLVRDVAHTASHPDARGQARVAGDAIFADAVNAAIRARLVELRTVAK